MGTHKIKIGNRIISLLLTAAVLLAMMGDSIHAEAAGQQARERKMPENPVHHCNKQNQGQDDTDWDYVYFGSYPQTEVTGNVLTEEIIGADYDENGDAVVDGEKYRRLSKSDTNNDTNFGDSDYRYFKWERIKWRVLQKKDDTLFVMADKGLDCKCYNDSYSFITWENCELRNWLNGSFYHTALSIEEQGMIVEQNVVNEDNKFIYNAKPVIVDGGNDTRDKLYLLSAKEVCNSQYGFCDNYHSKSRYCQASDYAHTKGTSITFTIHNGYKEENCGWWSRSPGDSQSKARYVSSGIINSFGESTSHKRFAVVPVLHIDLSSDLWTTEEDDNGHEHDFSKKTLTEEYLESPADCTKAATYYYACSICDLKGTETYEEGEPLGHDFRIADNGDGTHAKVCQRCSLSTERETHHGGSGNCITKRRCEVCNAEYGEFDTTVHGETEVRDAKAATCAEMGYTGDTYCKACNAKIETGQAIPATGIHTWNDGVATKTPNCTEKGEKEYTCTVCGAKKTEEDGGPLGHIWEVTDNGDGTHSGICQRCSLSVDREAHHGGSGNCITKRRCEVCNAEYGDFDTTVHGKTEVRDAKAATCAEKGYTGDTYCKACNAKIENGQAIPATGNHAWDKGKVIKTPSCTHEGQREYICTVCGVVRQETLGKSAHDYETILTKATGFTDGNRMEQCIACGDMKSNKTILHVGSVILNHTSYTYNGKPKKPSVTLKDTDGKVIDGRNYTVTYEGNTKVGNARVTILLKEDYAGAIFRTFEICPEGTSISGKVTSRNRGFQVRWKKRKRNVTGYEVQYSTNKRFAGKETVTKTIKKKSATKLTVQNLKPGKKYYVRVRTYKTVKKKKFCSAWSKSGSVMTGK